jgi:hypothetical protein
VTMGTRDRDRGVGGTQARAAARLAWSSFALALLILAAGSMFRSPDASTFLLFALIAAPFAVVGALVASRRPRNPIGWLFLAFAVVAAFAASADRYASYALVEHPGSLPGGAWVAWTASGIWHPAFGFFVFSFLLFPDGRLPSGRWRPVAWIAAANYLVGGVLGLLWGPLFGEFFPYAEPPFRLPDYSVVGAAFGVFLLVNFALLALSAVSLVLRLRRATGVERQQLKWFVYAVALFALVFPPSVFVFGDGRLIVFLLPLVPAAAGIAILRYRLFDIDVVINRTLVYGSLTVLLVVTYFGGVVGLQFVFRTLTGQESQLAIVASTLAIAALFVPLRRRVQGFVDRRFYRRKYDAAKTLQSFSTKLRDETDLGALNDELVGVIRRTMQPAHVGFWLRPPPGGGKVGGEGREQ